MEEQKECVWIIKEMPCNGSVKVVKLFNGQIEVPCCEAHFQYHKKFIQLYRSKLVEEDSSAKHTSEELDKLLSENNLNIDNMTEEEW